MGELIYWRKKILDNQPHIITTNDTIVQFNTNMIHSLKECKINFLPIQEGSGDPSLSNVRSIIGWTGCTTYHTEKNLFNPATPYRDVGFNEANKILNKNDLLAGMETGQQLFYGMYFDTTTYEMKYNTRNSVMLIFCVKPNTTYIFKGSYNNGQTNHHFIKTTIHGYDKDLNYVENIPSPNGVVTVPDNNRIAYASVYVENYAQTTAQNPWTIDDIKNTLQIEIGSTATNYANYTGSITPITFPDGEIYGGYIDLATGEVWETYHKITLDGTTTNCKVNSDYSTDTYIIGGVVYLTPSGANDYYSGYRSKLYCNNTPIIGAGDNTLETLPFIRTIGNGSQYLRIYMAYTADHPELDTAQKRKDFCNAYLIENPMDIVYPLRTNQLITTLTPIQIKSLIGVNNIWSNTNENIDVKYWTR